MGKIYFLPQRYLEEKNNKKRKIMKFTAILFIVADLILLEFIFIGINKNKLLKDKLNEEIILKKDYSLRERKIYTKNSKTLDTFLIFNKNIKNVNFESIEIEGKNINLYTNTNNSDYMELIKEIEIKNLFRIKQFLVLEDKSDNKEDNKTGKKAKITLELR